MEAHAQQHPPRSPRRVLSLLFWALTGAVIGVGIITIVSVGWFLLFVGLGLSIFGAYRVNKRGLWAVLVGFGALPALILQYSVATAPPLCPPGGTTIPAGTPPPAGMVCGGPTDTYQLLAVVFAIIAVAGLLIGLIVEARRSRGARIDHFGPIRRNLFALLVSLGVLSVLLVGSIAAYEQAGWPLAFAAFPVVEIVLSFTLGARGFWGVLGGLVALELLVIGANFGMQLAFPSSAVPAAVAADYVRTALSVGGLVVSGALGGAVGLLLRSIYAPGVLAAPPHPSS